MLLAEASQTEFLGTALLFSAATPLGVGLGALISSYCKSAEALGLMAAIAAGTFIHVAAIEIIPSAFRDTSATHLAKLASLTVGYLAMSALFLVE
jgi:zinc transporter ZupT